MGALCDGQGLGPGRLSVVSRRRPRMGSGADEHFCVHAVCAHPCVSFSKCLSVARVACILQGNSTPPNTHIPFKLKVPPPWVVPPRNS